MTSPASLNARTRRRRRGSDLVVNDLLDAALVEFAAHGFDGASTRAIAQRAGAHQPQINYFFSSKEQLWQAAVNRVFELLGDSVDEPLGLIETNGLDEREAIVEAFSEAVRRFVRFSADRPDLNRIMNLEATSDSARLRWLVETHVRPRYERIAEGWEAIRDAGAGADLTAIEVFQLVIGFGALPYANAPMLGRLPVGAPARPARRATPAQVEAHADHLVALLFPAHPRRPRGG